MCVSTSSICVAANLQMLVTLVILSLRVFLDPGKTSMRERDVESFLVEAVAKLGGRAFKFVSPGTAGVTDRLLLLPVPPRHQAIVAKYVKLVEVKAPGESARPLQLWFIREVRGLGHCAVVVDGRAAVEELLR